MNSKNIRNFGVVAHIDHGKSTLADRIMEITGAIDKKHQEQLLDSLELEREHGITIKLKAIRLSYSVNSEQYTLNLIDTPGHVDFSYEVSRSLASIEGAVLIVDATQGIQAQTLSNFNLALEANLTLIPVINKIDMPHAQIEKTEKELESLGFTKEEIVKVSAKTGENVEKLIEEIIKRIPPPKDTADDKLAGLIFDSSLDPYKGVIVSIRLFSGKMKVGDEILFIATKAKATIMLIGYLSPTPTFVEEISAGEVGFIITNTKDLSKVKVGDTVTLSQNPAHPLPGYREAKPVVFLSYFPTDTKDFPKLEAALEKLKLSDAALAYTKESSPSLGQGFRVGFLGLLHSQITQERLEREHNLDIIATSPSVIFKVDGQEINKPEDFDPTTKNVEEPMAKITVFIPEKYFGAVSNLIYERRGVVGNSETIANSLKVEATIPLLEILTSFYDRLKTITSGYASFDFEIAGYQTAKLVKLDILVNHEPVEALAQIIPVERADEIGRKLTEKLKDAIPRQQIPIPIQAAVGGKILARETIPSFRKDVTAKLYGGDVTRKNKLLEKQKKGKKRMRRFGQVEIPQEAFLAVLKI